MLDALSHPDPQLVWGLISRGIGLTLLIAFASLVPQVLALAGQRGITPIADGLAASQRDFPAPQRFLYFPTLLWLNRSDGFLRALPIAGALCAGSIVIGGPHVPWAFLAAYLLYLSLDRAATLIYPWDCLLFEATLLATLLPTTEPLPSLAATAPPNPATAWVFRLLVLRVMLGFGKHKFLGTTPQDKGFLKGFFVSQPLPTPLGLWAHRLPIGFHRLALFIMFVVEVPLPLLVFWPGTPSAVAGLGMILLMLGIQLTGNFGFFNLAMVVLSLSWLDTATATALDDEPWRMALDSLPYAVLVGHTALALICFPFNSFCAHSWMLWSLFLRARTPLVRWPATLLRWLHPFRLVHAYGVFPPQSPPPIKLSPVTEVSWDGENFEPVRHRYWPTTEDSPAVFCAPHHERVDQAVVYEALGLNESMVYRNIAGRFDPYGHGGSMPPERMLHLMLSDRVPRHAFYDRSSERERGAPRHARIRLYTLTPTSPAERRATGATWQKQLVGPHLPLRSAGQPLDRPCYPPPELWHFEDLVWLLRSRFGEVMRRAERTPGANPDVLVLEQAPDLSEEDLTRLWDELLPAIPAALRHDWRDLRRTVDALRSRFDSQTLYRLERVAHRYAALLFARLYPRFRQNGIAPALGFGAPTIPVPSQYHLRLLCLDIVTQGRSTFDTVWRDPKQANAHARELNMFGGHLLTTLFRYETVVYQSQKLRLMRAVNEHAGRPEPSPKQRADKAQLVRIGTRLWGNLEAADFLRDQLKGTDHQLDVPEHWPRFEILPSGEVVPQREPPAAHRE